MATQDFKQIIESVLQPYKAKFAEMATASPGKPADKTPVPLTKEEVESERNRLLADSVPPEVFDKLMAMMNKTVEGPIQNGRQGSFRPDMPTPLATGGQTAKGAYIVGERGPELFFPKVPGYVMSHEESFHGETPIPGRAWGGEVDPFYNPMNTLAYQLKHGGIVQRGLNATFHPDEAMKDITRENSFMRSMFPEEKTRSTPIQPAGGWRDVRTNVPIPAWQEEFEELANGGFVIPGRAEGGGVKPYDPWDEYIKEASEKYRVDPSHLYGILGAEASENWQKSKKGAMGRFQFMPATLRNVAKGTEYESVPIEEIIANPRAQTHLAAKHWADLAGKYENPVHAAGAWNLGEPDWNLGARPEETLNYMPRWQRAVQKAKAFFAPTANANPVIETPLNQPVVETPISGLGLRNQIRQRMGRPLVAAAPTPLENVIHNIRTYKPQPQQSYSYTGESGLGDLYTSEPEKPAAFSGVINAVGDFLKRGFNEKAVPRETAPIQSPSGPLAPTNPPRVRDYEETRRERPTLLKKIADVLGPREAMADTGFTYSPEGYPWTTEEFQALGFEKGSQPFRNPWNVEMIRGTPYSERYIRGPGGTVTAIPGGSHTMAGPGGETPIPNFEKRWGMGPYSADYKPSTVKGYNENGDEVLFGYNPKTAGFEVISKGPPPREAYTADERMLNIVLPALAEIEKMKPEAPYQGMPTDLYNKEYAEWKQRYDAVRAMIPKRFLGGGAPQSIQDMSLEQFRTYAKENVLPVPSDADIDLLYRKIHAGGV